MREPLVVVDTSPLLYLHSVGCLDLLHQLYGTIIVPEQVAHELTEGRKRGYSVPDLQRYPWMKIRTAKSKRLVSAYVDLGFGEAEVLSLGLEKQNSLLILDDQLARRIADLHGLVYTGTLGVLLRAKQKGYLPSIRKIIFQLEAQGMWLHKEMLRAILKLSGE